MRNGTDGKSLDGLSGHPRFHVYRFHDGFRLLCRCGSDHHSCFFGQVRPRGNRIVWVVISAVSTVVLLYVGGFDAVELLALFLGIPMCILIFAAIFIVARMVRKDNRSDSEG